MIRTIKLVVLVCLLAMVVACQPETVVEEVVVYADEAGDFAFEESAEADFGGDADFAEPVAIGGNSVGNSANQQTNQVDPSASQQRLIIRNGTVDVVVTDTDEAIATITQMVEANGGWVVDSSVFQYGDDAKRGSMTFRIPVQGFNGAIEMIRSVAVEVTSESSSGQDVTEEFVDLSSRLENLEVTAERVRGFLQQASDVEEALDVNQELSRLEGEIEVIRGRMQFLSQSAAFSTITVNFTPDILAQPIETSGWRPNVVVRESVETLVTTVQGLIDVLIRFVIVALPFLLLLGVPAWFIWRRVNGGRRQTPMSSSPSAGNGGSNS